MPNRIFLADNLEVLRGLPSGAVDLVYIDPPFNTGKPQGQRRQRVRRSEEGRRVGFHGHRYEVEESRTSGFVDGFDDYLGFLEPRLREAHRVLAEHGSLYVHLDYREVHYVKVLLDSIFGRANFLNEVVWAYDFGGRPTDRWPPKHDNLLLYAKRAGHHRFERDAVERIPYMAPKLVSKEKAERGKLPTDVWWHTIVPTSGSERTGYPTQKPLGILRRVLEASSRPGDLVLDFFAGSGTTGAAALELGRRFLLVDHHPEAIAVMRQRFAGRSDVEFVGTDESPKEREITAEP